MVSGAQSSVDNFSKLEGTFPGKCLVKRSYFDSPKQGGPEWRESLRASYQHPPLDLQRPVTKDELCVNLFKKKTNKTTLGAFILLFEFFTTCICIFCSSGYYFVVLFFSPQYTENSKVITSWIPFPPWGEKVAICHRHLRACRFSHFLIGGAAPLPLLLPRTLTEKGCWLTAPSCTGR